MSAFVAMNSATRRVMSKRRWTPLCEFDEREIAVDWRNGLQSAVATDCNLMAECGGEMF